MTTQEAADCLSFKRETLNQWRIRKQGPPYVKFGKAVRYRREDLDAWVEERLTDSSAGTRQRGLA